MQEITELYKNRVDELTNRLLKLQADTTLSAFYANESLLNAVQSMVELCRFVVQHPSDKETICQMASKRLCDWLPLLSEVRTQSAKFKERISAMGISTEIEDVE